MSDYHFIALNLVILINYMQMKAQEVCECQSTNFNKNALIFLSSNYINWILIATFAQHICENCISTQIDVLFRFLRWFQYFHCFLISIFSIFFEIWIFSIRIWSKMIQTSDNSMKSRIFCEISSIVNVFIDIEK